MREDVREALESIRADRPKAALEEAVGAVSRRLLRRAKVKPGCTIKVNRGRHAGFVGIVETVNWPEAEVRCHGNPRWFSLWHHNDYFEVVDA